MPTDIHNRPLPQALRIIHLARLTSSIDPDNDYYSKASEVHKSLLIEASVNKPNRAWERWRKAVAEVLRRRAFMYHYSNDQRLRLRKGFIILQQDIIRPIFEELMAKLPQLKEGESCDFLKHAFISYAWPIAKPDRTALQSQLLSIVQDMALARVEVQLDILRLTIGVNITEFMKSGIEKSDCIFWIGTPRLVERIAFNSDGSPANPATTEFCHISNKIQEPPSSLYLLHFLGESPEKAFPPLLDSQSTTLPVLDFREEREYFRMLPQLAAAVLGVDEHPEYQRLFSEFCAKVRGIESSFTTASILTCLETAEKELQEQATKIEMRIQKLLSGIPDSLLHELEGTKEAQVNAFRLQLTNIRATALAKSTAELDLYIPLKGGTQLDTPPESYFEVKERIAKFLAEDNEDKRVMLVQGGPGSGKTLFGRFLERHLWKEYCTGGFIPIFLSLPNASNPYSGLIEEALQDLGCNNVEREHLIMERFVFILDGLDELPLDSVPSKGILFANEILAFTNAKVLITARDHYIAAIEQKFGVTAHQHLAQQLSSVEEVYMMPFDTAQINKYLAEYCRSPEAEWNDWYTFRHHIDTIPGLAALAQNPFMLKLLTGTLPRLLVTTGIHSRKIESVDIYKAFTDLWFEREMWKQLINTSTGIPPAENRIMRYRSLAQQIGQSLFTIGSTSIHKGKLRFTQSEEKILDGLPITQNNGNISFIHKSVQEFFTACAWIESLTSTKVSPHDLFGTRIASSEAGLLKFVAQLFNYNEHHEALVNMVLASREYHTSDPHIIAAANAITVLNSARFSFAGMNLSRINIKGAILDNALLHETDFSEGSLTDVSMKEIWAQGANFSGATFSNVWFGREANVILSGECFGVAINNRGYVAMTVAGTVHTPTHKIDLAEGTFVKWTCFTVRDEVLFAGTYGGKICSWDLRSGSAIASFGSHSRKVASITIFAGAVISGGGDKTICIRDIGGGDIRQRLIGHNGEVTCVVGIQGRVISGSNDGTIRVWSMVSGKQISAVSVGACVNSLAFFDGKIVSGTADSLIQIWNASNLKQLGEVLQGHEGSVTTVAWFEGRIVSGSLDGTVRVWDTAKGKQVGDFMSIQSPVVSLALKGRKIYVGCKDTKIQVWDVLPKPQLQADNSLMGYSDRINSVCLIGEGNSTLIVVGADDATVQLLDATKPRQVMSPLTGHASTVNCMVPYNDSLVSVGGEELLQWDISTGEVKSRIRIGHVNFLEVFDGQAIVAGWGGMSVYDIASGRGYSITKEPVLLMAVDAVWGFAGLFMRHKLELFDLQTRKWLGPLDIADGMRCIKCIKGLIIVGLAVSSDIEIWDFQNKILIATLRLHTRPVVKLATSGGKLASCDARSVRVWDLESFECIGVVSITDDITAMAVSDEWLVVATGEAMKLQKSRVWWWKVDTKRNQLWLAGRNPGRWLLNVQDCNAVGVKGLSREQRTLLHQLGARNVNAEQTVSH